ncbi:MAG: YDG domain-containing protein, partial [Candidatus Methylumidiphilus sp.]
NNGSGNAANYQIAATGNTGQIDRASLVLAGVRAYDSTTVFAGATFGTGGLIGTGVNGETLTVGGTTASGSVSSPDASAIPYALTTAGLTLNNGSGNAANYQIAATGNTANITPANIILSGFRTYDGTTDFDTTTFGNSGEITTGIGQETLLVSGGPGAVPSRNAGPAQTLTPGTLGLEDGANGGLASNYQFAASGHTGIITPADLYLFAAEDKKTYDGTTNSSGVVTYSGLIGTDDLSNLSQSFDSKNAGPRIINVNSDYTISDGNGGNNYLITQFDAIGQIDQAKLNLNALRDTKYYDGNTISNKTPSVFGLVSGDFASNLSQRFDSPLTGIRQLFVNPGYVVNDGNGGNNYSYIVANAPGEILAPPTTGDIAGEIEPKYGYRYQYNTSGEHPLKFNLSAFSEVAQKLTIVSGGVNIGEVKSFGLASSGNINNIQAIDGDCPARNELIVDGERKICQSRELYKQDETEGASTITAPWRPRAY